jgi:hypothetical protein
MKILALIVNLVFWLFFCMVMVTDGPPTGTDILWSLVPFVVPIFNVVVIRILSSPTRAVKLVALASNIVWLGLACSQVHQHLCPCSRQFYAVPPAEIR